MKSIRQITSLYRTYSTQIEDASLPLASINLQKVKSPRKSTKEPKIAKEILNYFNDPERTQVLKGVPVKLLRKKSSTVNGLYLMTDKTAEKIADVLVKDLKPHQTLIEVNPGLGLLTKHLANRIDNDLVLYEPLEEFHRNLSVRFRFYR